jgi:hypothetical protein
MTKRTRLFLVIAAGILVTGLGTGLLAAYKTGGFQNLVLIGSDGPDELSYIPKNARMVAYADVRAIMTSDLRQKFHAMQQQRGASADPSTPPRDPSQTFQAQTGINIETDVDHVLAAAIGSQSGDRREDRPVLLVHGRFDEVRIEGLIREHGGTVEDYKGKRLLTQNEQHLAVAFVEPGLVAAGSPEDVRLAIDTKAGTITVKDNPDVMRLVKDIDDGTAWAVARFDAVAETGRIPGSVASQLPAVNWFAATGHIDDGVRGSVRAEARDEMAAKDLQEVIRGFMALARLQAGQHAEFGALINSLELSGQGNTVVLGFAIPPELIDTIGAMRADRGRSPGTAPARPDGSRRPARPRPDARPGQGGASL